MQQSLSIQSGLAQIEALDSGRPMQMQERKLELGDLCLAHVELYTELVEELLGSLHENRAVDALLAELGNRAPGLRRLELGPQIEATAERSVELVQIRTPDSARETISRQSRAIPDRTKPQVNE